MSRVDRLRGQPERERVVQDVEIPLDRTADFVEWFLREVPIEPVWLCPIQLRPAGVDGDGDADTPWPLYPMARDERYVNVGFWSSVPIAPGAAEGDVNRRIEAEVTRLGGHKSLYSDAYYDEATFARLYGGAAYAPVKARYDPQGRLPSLYEKAVHAR
jgi:FAD/FMN-containing dehydrogenase